VRQPAKQLIAPGAFLLIALIILPALSVFMMSLTDWEFGKRTLAWVGIANFVELADDPRFRAAFFNTLVYTVVVTPVTVVWGLLLALLIDGSGRMRDFYRAIHFLPMIATLAAMALAWDAILHPTVGLLNGLLESLGLQGHNWLREESLVLPSLIVIGIWHNLGFAVIMFMASLRTVPAELLDAAAIDGVISPFDRLRTVLLPLLSPVALFVLIITAERSFGLFDTVKVLTRGGPGYASDTLLHMLYVESFERLRAGYGAAITVIYLTCLAALTLVQQKSFDRKAHYQ
jgi:multiple sugar transport system permease protein